VNQQFYAPTSSYYSQQATTTAATDQTSQSSLTQSYAGGGAGQASQTSISDVLAAASERVLDRCGLEYDETAGMYYDANSALFYDQVCIILWAGRSLIISFIQYATTNCSDWVKVVTFIGANTFYASHILFIISASQVVL
jgi:hypothetical protein